MNWQDQGIIISARNYGEASLIVTVLTKEHGLMKGMVKGIKHSKTIAQPGNRVSARWQARLPEHLGTFTLELTDSILGFVLDSRIKLSALKAASALLEHSLAERDPNSHIYKVYLNLLSAFKTEEWEVKYIEFELELLKRLGFGLDLNSCAVTGQTSDLSYVSPKSGRAVTRGVGEPYKEKLLPYPSFLKEKNNPNPGEFLDCLRLTGYFIKEYLAFREPLEARNAMIDLIIS